MVKGKYPVKLLEKLKEQFRDGSCCDATLKVNGGTIEAHRCILAAASPYFNTLYFSIFSERQEQEVDLSHVFTPASVLRNIVEYIYGEEIIITEENVSDFLAGAHYLMITEITLLCLKFLVGNLKLRNCLWTWTLAEIYSFSDLIVICQELAISRFHDCLIGMEETMTCHPEYLLKFLDQGLTKHCSNPDARAFIKKYVAHDFDRRKSYLSKLQQKIDKTSRFPEVPKRKNRKSIRKTGKKGRTSEVLVLTFNGLLKNTYLLFSAANNAWFQLLSFDGESRNDYGSVEAVGIGEEGQFVLLMQNRKMILMDVFTKETHSVCPVPHRNAGEDPRCSYVRKTAFFSLMSELYCMSERVSSNKERLLNAKDATLSVYLHRYDIDSQQWEMVYVIEKSKLSEDIIKVLLLFHLKEILYIFIVKEACISLFSFDAITDSILQLQSLEPDFRFKFGFCADFHDLEVFGSEAKLHISSRELKWGSSYDIKTDKWNVCSVGRCQSVIPTYLTKTEEKCMPYSYTRNEYYTISKGLLESVEYFKAINCTDQLQTQLSTIPNLSHYTNAFIARVPCTLLERLRPPDVQFDTVSTVCKPRCAKSLVARYKEIYVADHFATYLDDQDPVSLCSPQETRNNTDLPNNTSASPGKSHNHSLTTWCSPNRLPLGPEKSFVKARCTQMYSPTYSPTSTPVSPEWSPTSPSYSPTSPNVSQASPTATPVSPEWSPTSPRYSPTSPNVSPASPTATPVSPEWSPTSPRYSPTSPNVSPASPTATPVSPEWSPTSPRYSPTSPNVSPASPTATPVSPEWSPTSPRYSPTSPIVSPTATPVSPEWLPPSSPYSPLSPAFSPASPSHIPLSPEKSPTSPSCTPVSPEWSPISPAYSPSSPIMSTASPSHKPILPESSPTSPLCIPVSPDSPEWAATATSPKRHNTLRRSSSIPATSTPARKCKPKSYYPFPPNYIPSSPKLNLSPQHNVGSPEVSPKYSPTNASFSTEYSLCTPIQSNDPNNNLCQSEIFSKYSSTSASFSSGFMNDSSVSYSEVAMEISPNNSLVASHLLLDSPDIIEISSEDSSGSSPPRKKGSVDILNSPADISYFKSILRSLGVPIRSNSSGSTQVTLSNTTESVLERNPITSLVNFFRDKQKKQGSLDASGENLSHVSYAGTQNKMSSYKSLLDCNIPVSPNAIDSMAYCHQVASNVTSSVVYSHQIAANATNSEISGHQIPTPLPTSVVYSPQPASNVTNVMDYCHNSALPSSASNVMGYSQTQSAVLNSVDYIQQQLGIRNTTTYCKADCNLSNSNVYRQTGSQITNTMTYSQIPSLVSNYNGYSRESVYFQNSLDYNRPGSVITNLTAYNQIPLPITNPMTYNLVPSYVSNSWPYSQEPFHFTAN